MLRSLFVLWLAGCALLAQTPAPASQSAKPGPAEEKAEEPDRDWAEEGMKALEAGKHAEAAALFEKAVAAAPEDFAAHFHLGLALSLSGQAEPAIAAYRKTLELKPGLYQAQLNLGILLVDSNRMPDAIPLLKDAVEAKPSEFRPNYYLAEALAATGEFAEAKSRYEAALAADPESAPAHYGMGRALAGQGEWQSARQSYEKAAALDDRYKPALLELAELLERNQKTDEALAIYENFRDNIAVRERIGHLMLKAGKAKLAIPELLWAVERSPTPANRLALASAYLKTADLDLSLAQVELALRQEPDNAEVHLLRARLLRDQKKFTEAASGFLEAAKRNPSSPEPWSELAAMRVLLENYPQALAALSQLEKTGGFKTGHYFLRAIVFDKLKDHERALPEYEKFLAESNGASPDEEFKARQRARIIRRMLEKK